MKVAAASEEIITQILSEMRVVGTTQVARHSSEEAQKTEQVVQVEIKESLGSTVDSKQDKNRHTDSSAFDDKGDSTEEACLLQQNCPSRSSSRRNNSRWPSSLPAFSGQSSRPFS